MQVKTELDQILNIKVQVMSFIAELVKGHKLSNKNVIFEEKA